MRAFLAILSVLLLTVAVNAQSIRGVVKGQPISIVEPALSNTWKIEEITDGSVPSEIVPDKRENASNGLPDGKIAVPKIRKISPKLGIASQPNDTDMVYWAMLRRPQHW